MTQPYGVMDFSALKRENRASGTTEPLSDEIAVTEEGLQELIDSSQHQVTLLLITSARVQNGASFVDDVRKHAARHAGTIRLALVDADQQPRVAAALRAQTIPAAMLLMQGQLQPLFEGAIVDEQLGQVMDQIAQLALQQGLAGPAAEQGAQDASAADGAEAPHTPLDDYPAELAGAYEFLQTGDLAGAQKAFEDYLETHPGDVEGKKGLAMARLMDRTRGADLQAGREAAAQAPEDLEAQLHAADLDILGGHVDDAFGRILDRFAGADPETKDRLRGRLVELFDIVGASDERVAAARKRLARLMF